MNRFAFEAIVSFDTPPGGEILDKTFDHFLSDIHMCDFSAPEEKGQFDLVSLFEEATRMTEFRLVIMFLNLPRQLDLFNLDGVMFLTRFFLLLAQCV